MRSALLLLALVALTACPAKDPAQDGGVSVDGGTQDACNGACTADERCDGPTATCVLALPSRCGPGTRWTAGTGAFEDVSAKWGLVENVGAGVRISGADVDGDGWLDVVARRPGSVPESVDGGARQVWLLRNGHGLFEDITHASGLLTPRDAGVALRPAEVVVFADVDNDGDLDAYAGASKTPVETSEVMLNDGTGRFVLGPEHSDLRVRQDTVAGASFTDVDNDGFVDLWVANVGQSGGGQDRLYLGQGDGTFLSATAQAGLTTLPWTSVEVLNQAQAHAVSWGTAACDLNGDGRPELMTHAYGRAPNHLWQAASSGPVAYTGRSIASGYAFDENQDWTDNESARCWCKLHPTDPGCAGVPPPQYITCQSDQDAFRWYHPNDREPYRLGGNTSGTTCGDFDADGDLDLLLSELAHWDVGGSSDKSQLLRNTGQAQVRFERLDSAQLGLTRPLPNAGWDIGDFHSGIFDFDNDGRMDVFIGSSDYPGTRALLYHQKDDGTFEALSPADGIDHQSSNGLVLGDFDRDGDVDVLAGHSRNRCSQGTHCYPESHARLFENKIGQDGNWLQLELAGSGLTNRAAIGARITVKANGRTQALEVSGGAGHYGAQNDLVQHAGLGPACEAEVTIRWPDLDLTTETYTLPAGYRYRIVQGQRPQVSRP